MTKKMVVEQLSEIACDKEVSEKDRLKALELLGKAIGVFADRESGCTGTVRIIDDIPKS